VYLCVALYPLYTIIRGVLFLVAATFWILYFREIFFRSGRIRTHWLKKGLADLVLLLFIALVSSLFFLFLSGIQSSRHR
jgi:hypothetical protein